MKVLLGTDGGEAATHARRLLARIADRDRTEVVVCAVATFDMALKEASYSGRYSAEDAEHAARTIAAEADEELREDGFRTIIATPHGDPAAELLREARERGTELLLLGTGRETRLEAIVLGSTSSAVLQAAPSAVLIVHELHEHDGIGRAVVATDGSDDAVRAGDAFAALADPARCAVTVAAVARPAGLPGYGPDDQEAVDAAERDAATLAERLAEAGFEVDSTAVRGRPANELLQVARDRGADLIVSGSHGTGRLEAVVLGSVTSQLVRAARATLVGR